MPSISNELTIASRAIENILAASSVQKVTATEKQSAMHRRKNHGLSTEKNVNEEKEQATYHHIDLKA